MKKHTATLLSLALALSLSACGAQASPVSEAPPSESSNEPVSISVFAAASMEASLDQVIAAYEAEHTGVTVVPTYDSSGTLLKQIAAGAECDLFLSAAPKQMNALDGTLKDDAEKNPDGLDLILEGTRVNLLENKVTLAVPEGNPAGIESFDQLAQLLQAHNVLLAIGNSDVPVGQYTLKIFDAYGLEESAVASCLTYGSNVKEVTTQVSEGVVDCGIIYATDAYSAGLTVVDSATAEQCGQVIYPAAVLTCGTHSEIAQEFLAYLSGDTATAAFEAVGFSPLT